MKIDQYRCDNCPKEFRTEGLNLALHVDNEADPASGRSTPVIKHLDLCIDCAKNLMANLMKLLTPEARQKVIAQFSSKRK